MQKTPKSYTEGKYENTEISRRLHRSASEAARRLEERQRSAPSVKDRLAPEVTQLRARLKDYCERLLFAAPLEYGRQAEELTWRKVYYEPVLQFKAPKKGGPGKGGEEDEEGAVLLRAHLISGLGHYHHLLLRLQAEFGLDLESSLDVPLRWAQRGLPRGRWSQRRRLHPEQQQQQQHGGPRREEAVLQWARQTCHRLLLSLGDLARYLSELASPGSGERERWSLLSERYYWQALGIDPGAGMPHNQLGTLAGNNNGGCQAAYHYLRCLQSGQPFDGAQGNLLRLLDKNSRLLQEAQMSLSTGGTPTEGGTHLSHFTNNFLKLCEHFYTSADVNGIQSLCEETLEQLVALLEQQDAPTASMVFQSAVMCLLCTQKLRKSGPHPLESAATAFTLSLFSRVLAASATRLSLSSKINPPSDPQDQTHPDSDHDSCLDSGEGGSPPSLAPLSEPELDQEPQQLQVEVQVQTQPQQGQSSNLEDLSRTSPAPSTEEGSTNGSEQSNPTDPWSSHPDSEEGEGMAAPGNNSSSAAPGSGREFLLELERQRLLPCIKILCNWLRGHPELMASCSQTAGSLWHHLATLLNLLLRFEQQVLATPDGHQAMEHCTSLGTGRASDINGAEWAQGPPLPEDICLKGMASLLQGTPDWALQPPPSLALQSWLRLQCILQFGHWAARKTGSGISYCEEDGTFRAVGATTNGTSSPMLISNAGNESPQERQRKQVMRSMAHLWLEQEVRDLEGQVGESAPPFLVPHTQVLCSQLAHLKRLVASRRFVLVVPSHVISSLDLLKRESVGARESIRWLEGELRRGSRYVRSQKSHERLSLSPMKYPKRKDKDAWELFQMLECCHHLEEQCPRGGHPQGRAMVTLLTTTGLPPNASALARSAGINMEDIEVFVSKWLSPASRTQPG